MRFDKDEMEKVAAAVLHFNRYAQKNGDTVENIVAMMERLAYSELWNRDKITYLSTYGFVLTSYRCSGSDDVGIKASVNVSILLDTIFPKPEVTSEKGK